MNEKKLPWDIMSCEECDGIPIWDRSSCIPICVGVIVMGKGVWDGPGVWAACGGDNICGIYGVGGAKGVGGARGVGVRAGRGVGGASGVAGIIEAGSWS